MPGISILKLFTLFGIVSTWAEKALRDGKISLTEAAELAERLGPLLGVPVDVQIPGLPNPNLEPENSTIAINEASDAISDALGGERPHSRRSPTEV